MSNINKKGVPDDTEETIHLRKSFEDGVLPRQHHHAMDEHYRRSGGDKQVAVGAVTPSQPCKALHGAVLATVGKVPVPMDMEALHKKMIHMFVQNDLYHAAN